MHEKPEHRDLANLEYQVVLSDMSAPWPQTHGFSINSISNPYRRMMNTSGISFKDHARSMVNTPWMRESPRLLY